MTLNTKDLHLGHVGVGTTSPYQTVPATALVDEFGNIISEFTISAGIVTVTNIVNEVEIKNDSGNPVPVSGIVTATGPLTDSELRASSVPISGIVTATGPLTNAELRAAAIPVADNNSSLTVDGKAYRSTVTITRPSNTTTYSAGDVVGDTSGSAILTFTNAGPSGGFIIIQSVSLVFSDSLVPAGMGAFRLHLYSSTPTSINDNSPFNLVSGERDSYIGYIDMSTPLDFGNSLYAQTDYPGLLVKLNAASTTLFAELETRGTYTPVSASTIAVRINTLEAGL